MCNSTIFRVNYKFEHYNSHIIYKKNETYQKVNIIGYKDEAKISYRKSLRNQIDSKLIRPRQNPNFFSYRDYECILP